MGGIAINNDVEIIKILSTATTHISGTDLSLLLGISRNAVWKRIENLRKNGYEIEARPNLGYRLISTPGKIDVVEMQAKLKTKLIGSQILIYSQVDSTNTVAKDQAKRNAAEGLVVVAEEQTHGRGRRGRTWASQRGGLYCSILLRPKMSLSEVSQITLLTGITVIEVLREHYKLPAMLKWPNDVFVSGKKICGILTELSADPESIQYLVVGIGLNTNQTRQDWSSELNEIATSMRMLCDKEINQKVLLHHLLTAFEQNYLRFIHKQLPVIASAKQYAMFLGQDVQVVTQNETYIAKALDIDPSGALVVQDRNGKQITIWAADVSVRADKEVNQ